MTHYFHANMYWTFFLNSKQGYKFTQITKDFQLKTCNIISSHSYFCDQIMSLRISINWPQRTSFYSRMIQASLWRDAESWSLRCLRMRMRRFPWWWIWGRLLITKPRGMKLWSIVWTIYTVVVCQRLNASVAIVWRVILTGLTGWSPLMVGRVHYAPPWYLTPVTVWWIFMSSTGRPSGVIVQGSLLVPPHM